MNQVTRLQPTLNAEDFRLLGELIDRKIDEKLDKKFAEFLIVIDSRFEEFAIMVAKGFEDVIDRIDQLRQETNERFDKVYENMNYRFDGDARRMDDLSVTRVKYDDYHKLEKRVDRVEKKVGI